MGIQKVTNIAVYFLLFILAVQWLAPFLDDRVDVEIYRNDESGNMIYCESGDLNDEFHTYMGSGKISADKAVAC